MFAAGAEVAAQIDAAIAFVESRGGKILARAENSFQAEASAQVRIELAAQAGVQAVNVL